MPKAGISQNSVVFHDSLRTGALKGITYMFCTQSDFHTTHFGYWTFFLKSTAILHAHCP